MEPADRMQRACTRLVDFTFRRRRLVLLASLLAFAVTLAAASRLRISSDWVEPFLPRSQPELRSYADALHRFGDTETLFADVEAADRSALHAAADEVETRMRASGLFTRVLGRLSEWDLQRTAQAVGDAVPLLLDDEGLRELDARTEEEALSARMEEHYERLLGPMGGFYQDLLAKDPLELSSLVLERASSLRTGARIDRGRIVSADGRHALVTAVAAAKVGDEAGGAAIESFFDGLTREIRGAQLVWVGGHRHYLVNSRTLQRDMTWVSVLAVVLVLAVIFLGFRGARITWISAIAVLVGSVAGAAALAAVYPQCSGIALGFGAALSGISVDYVIHLHAERRSGETREAAVRRVFSSVGPSVVIGAVTSAAGFLILLLSDVPAHAQLGLAAAAGILGALLFALLPGPVIAAADKDRAPAARADLPNAFDRFATWMFGPILRRPAVAFAAGAVLVLAGVVAVPFLGVESDVRHFEVRDKAVDQAQDELARTWGDVFAQQLVTVPGPDVQTVLERTDALTAALRPLAGTPSEFVGIASTSPVLPSVATQRTRLATWRKFWTPERRERVRAGLAQAASEFQIRATTFDPFFASLDADPTPVTETRLAGTPLESAVARHLSIHDGDVLGLVVLTGASRDPSATWPDLVHRVVPEARILSGRGLADAVVAATRHQFAVLALPALGIVALLLAIYYRSVALALVGVFPLVGGLAVAAACLVLAGERVNLINAAVALPVFGLGVDYAIFLMDAMRDAARDHPDDPARRIHEVGQRMGTMIGDVLTTVAGSIAMLFASTPVIASIGLALTAGVLGAMAVAWLMVPQALLWTGRTRR